MEDALGVVDCVAAEQRKGGRERKRAEGERG